LNIYLERKKSAPAFRALVFFILLTFSCSILGFPQGAYAQNYLGLPAPGVLVPLSPVFMPALLKGIKIDPETPFQFDFIVDSGDSGLKDQALKEESTKLIKYFLASLTVPEEELWVNLSPYEKDRIIPADFGLTEMGRDLLAQDYILKQLTASLIYPEQDTGKKFWEKVYAKAFRKYGTTNMPMNTFNKIWIVPDKAVVYEHNGTAYVIESHLKVMLEEDYLALENNIRDKERGTDRLAENDVKVISGETSDVVREVLIPQIEKEVNSGKNFAQLRQIYHSLILAAWYKKTLKESLLSKIYVDQNKVLGVDAQDKQIKEKIYEQYIHAYKQGVYDYIREDYDSYSRKVIPRKYFSGGFTVGPHFEERTLEVTGNPAVAGESPAIREVGPGNVSGGTIKLLPQEKTPDPASDQYEGNDGAMMSGEELEGLSARMPGFAWGNASRVEQKERWREAVRFLDPKNPEPISANQKKYLSNLTAAREEFLRLLNDLPSGEITPAEFNHLKERFAQVHRFLLTGADGRSVYVPPIAGREVGGDEEKIKAWAGQYVRRGSRSGGMSVDSQLAAMLSDLQKIMYPRNPLSDIEKIELIAQFYRTTMLNEFLFPGGNQSFAMDMVNGLLRLQGPKWKGIAHGFLDVEVFGSSMMGKKAEDFVPNFVQKVRAANPEVFLDDSSMASSPLTPGPLTPQDIMDLVRFGKTSDAVAKSLLLTPSEFSAVREMLLLEVERAPVTDNHPFIGVGDFFLQVRDSASDPVVRELADGGMRYIEEISEEKFKETLGVLRGAGFEFRSRVSDSIREEFAATLEAMESSGGRGREWLMPHFDSFSRILTIEPARLAGSDPGRPILHFVFDKELTGPSGFLEEVRAKKNLTEIYLLLSMILHSVEPSHPWSVALAASAVREQAAKQSPDVPAEKFLEDVGRFSVNYLGITLAPERIQAVREQLGRPDGADGGGMASSPIPADSSASGAREPSGHSEANPGGIDLNPANLSLDIKGDSSGVPVSNPAQSFQNIHVDGFVPVIIQMAPIPNLPAFLGISQTEKDNPLDSAGLDSAALRLGRI